MKKGDIIAKELIIEQGTPIAHGFLNEEDALIYIKRGKLNGKVEPDCLNEGKVMIVYKSTHHGNIEAHVNWRVDDAVGISYLNTEGSGEIDLKEEPDWKVIQESAPSYQSKVAQMSEEELKESIESLRTQRASLPSSRVKKVRAKAEPVDTSPLALKLAAMPADKRAELMKKLGLT